MKISNTQIINKSHQYCATNVGELYFFKNYLVAELKEGVIIDSNSFAEVQHCVYHYYGNRPFGFIANRVNSYSINLSDTSKFNKDFPNLVAYAVISYNELCEKVYKVEDHFFKYNRRLFKNLEKGVSWVENILPNA